MVKLIIININGDISPKNLVLTSPGERIMLPDFGAGLRRLLFDQQGKQIVPKGIHALF